MRFDRPVRLPLHVGATTAWNMARSALAMLILLGLPLMNSDVVGIVLGAVLFFYAPLRLVEGLMAWPTDVLIDADGIRVEGGLDKPARLRWSELAVEECRIDEKQEAQRGLAKTLMRTGKVLVFSALIVPLAVIVYLVDRIRPIKKLPMPDLDEGHTTVWTLTVVPRSGKPIALAEAERPIERDSMSALLATFRAAAGIDEPPARVPSEPGDPRLLCCSSCGAAVAPVDVDAVPCRYCEASVQVPAELRDRLRSIEQVDASRKISEALVARLLAQPVARRAGSQLKVASWAMHLSWAAAIGLTLHLWWQERLAPRNSLLLIGGAVAAIAAVFVVVRLALVDRYAFRLLTVEFAARPTPSGNYDCRCCGAPLAVERDRLIVRCAYCEADSILGIDLRHEREPTFRQKRVLEDAFRERARERRLWGGLALLSPALLALAGFCAYRGFNYRSGFAAQSEACWKGDGQSCVEVGARYVEGKGVDRDRTKALDRFERACAMRLAEGCYRAAEGHDFFADDRDSEEATDRYRKACDVGHAEACYELGERYRKGKGVAARDLGAARTAYERGCGAGSRMACFSIDRE